MKYEFLLFDLDNTLLDFVAEARVAFKKLYEFSGLFEQIPYSDEMFRTYEKHNGNWWKLFEQNKCTKPELFRGRFVDFLDETGLHAEPDKLNEDYFRFLGEGGVMFDGAEEMLAKLKERYKVYIITNGNAPTARARIRQSGVYKYIEDYFVSETVGVSKPDIRYFEYVFSHIPNFSPERAIVIGDTLSSDIQGAANAGIDSIWYHPGKPIPTPCPEFTYETETFEGILNILL